MAMLVYQRVGCHEIDIDEMEILSLKPPGVWATPTIIPETWGRGHFDLSWKPNSWYTIWQSQIFDNPYNTIIWFTIMILVIYNRFINILGS